MQLVCAVRDVKAEAYLPPFFVLRVDQARRMFGDACVQVDEKGERSPFGKHPEDYQLYIVGQWDEESGLLSGFQDGPRFVSGGVDFFPPVSEPVRVR